MMTMDLDTAIDRMFTCATAERCAREEACFRVVQWARDQRAASRLADATAQARIQEEAQDEIACYAPQWEAPRGLHAVDWDAA
jgi:hypothetical protein